MLDLLLRDVLAYLGSMSKCIASLRVSNVISHGNLVKCQATANVTLTIQMDFVTQVPVNDDGDDDEYKGLKWYAFPGCRYW